MVKNIHGRRWNSEQKVWEVPYTKLTIRFLEQYFPAQLLQWGFQPAQDLPERFTEGMGASEGIYRRVQPSGLGF